MTDDAPTLPPLIVEFEVAASRRHAFSTWVSRTELWWPPGHTMSEWPAAIVFEPQIGGRIFERDREGNELIWGEVLDWEPPSRVRFLWHLFFPRAEATEVDVTFTTSTRGTTVRLVQSGWDALGDEGPIRRERTVKGWATVTDRYRQQIESTSTT
ncbi:MAG: SRPBCC domain-containing protein [Acidimicrobiia bacterium]